MQSRAERDELVQQEPCNKSLKMNISHRSKSHPISPYLQWFGASMPQSLFILEYVEFFSVTETFYTVKALGGRVNCLGLAGRRAGGNQRRQ